MTNPKISYSALWALGCLHTVTGLMTLNSDIRNVTLEGLVFNDTSGIGAASEAVMASRLLRQGFRMEIGTPRQTVWLTPSLVLDEIIVRNASSCYHNESDLNQQVEYQLAVLCEYQAQGLYRSELSSSFENENDTIRMPPGRYSDEAGDERNNRSADYEPFIVSGTEFTENIGFPDASEELRLVNVEDLALDLGGRISNVQFPGFLGLGEDSEFLDKFFPRNKVFGVSFLQTEPPAVQMQLDLDGVDTSKSTGEIYSTRFPSDDDNGNDDDDDVYPFSIQVESMSLDGEELLTEPTRFHLDIGHVPGTKLPSDVYYRLTNLTGAYHDEELSTEMFATYNTSVSYNLAEGWNITVRFSNGYETKIPQSYLTQNIVYADGEEIFETKAVSTFYNAEETDNFGSGRILPGAVLGYEFLQFSYFMVDYERRQWSIAKSVHADQILNGAAEPAEGNTDNPPDADQNSSDGGNGNDNNPPPNVGTSHKADMLVLFCMTALTSCAAMMFS